MKNQWLNAVGSFFGLKILTKIRAALFDSRMEISIFAVLLRIKLLIR